MVILSLFVVVGAVPQFFAPHSPIATNLNRILIPPFRSLSYPLGTDDFGRDELSRLIFGAQVTLLVASAALAVAGGIGTVVGVVAGYVGGWVDVVLMRFVDAILSVPIFLVALVVGITIGPSMPEVILVVGGLLWAQYARVIRARTLELRQQQFVLAAVAGGLPLTRILRRHILPNVMPTVIALLTSQAGAVIIIEASLSFLGAGVPPPAPDWGTMVSDGQSLLVQAWWVSVIPGLAIVVVVLAFNVLGDWLQRRIGVGI
jgi:peptide/nickel transport system permease protein